MFIFWIYFAILITILLFVWSFFLVAKIHVYKFKEYSCHLQPATRIVGAILLVMTLIGFYMVFQELSGTTAPKTTVQQTSSLETY